MAAVEEKEGEGGERRSDLRLGDVVVITGRQPGGAPATTIDRDGNEYNIVVNQTTGAAVAIDKETCDRFAAVQTACGEYGVPCCGVFGVAALGAAPPDTYTSAAAARVAAQYRAAVAAGDPAATSWIAAQNSIQKGDVDEFERRCADDPGFATRVGTAPTGYRPIHVACSTLAALPILMRLLEMPDVRGSLNDVRTASHKLPLDYAVALLVPEAVDALLAAGADAAKLDPTVIPKFVTDPEGRLPEPEAIDAVRIMEALPTTRGLWDVR
jgi:hypothetical protein